MILVTKTPSRSFFPVDQATIYIFGLFSIRKSSLLDEVGSVSSTRGRL